ncbi:MAG: hypothetical protein UW90_C0012G0006 [Candidatus Yanofskybacteria bacterium GW2011_GWB1_45_11]|uniref:Uncharacterized protein n=1 Tax=Candidatus Yanofskybacteria bacterium GW2011_GWB1_45_11 TaxID=1619026 RepID=A0A0G1N9U9_9BACT|nr:MAG: hypothetical protein UW90_C0012G0006 [Candidatus Yanofskybacteria bacterium GW2011_GWB1_45_11]
MIIFLFFFYKILYEPVFLTGSFAVLASQSEATSESLTFPTLYPRQESDPHQLLRRELLYPLSYGGILVNKFTSYPERVRGFAPRPTAWKAVILLLYDTRKLNVLYQQKTVS